VGSAQPSLRHKSIGLLNVEGYDDALLAVHSARLGKAASQPITAFRARRKRREQR